MRAGAGQSCHPIPAGSAPGQPPATPARPGGVPAPASPGIKALPGEGGLQQQGGSSPLLVSPPGGENVPQQRATAKLGLPQRAGQRRTPQPARRERTSPRPVFWGGRNPAPGSASSGHSVGALAASAALPRVPALGDNLAVLVPSPLGGDTAQRGCKGHVPASHQRGHQRWPPPPCSLCPERFRKDAGTHGAAGAEPWQRGSRLSVARTRVPWGDTGRGGGAGSVRWQRLEPLPPADSVSAALAVEAGAAALWREVAGPGRGARGCPLLRKGQG